MFKKNLFIFALMLTLQANQLTAAASSSSGASSSSSSSISSSSSSSSGPSVSPVDIGLARLEWMMERDPRIRTVIEARRAARAAGITAARAARIAADQLPTIPAQIIEPIFHEEEDPAEADLAHAQAHAVQILAFAENQFVAFAALEDPVVLQIVLNVLESIRPYVTVLNATRLSTIFTVHQMIDAIHDVLNNPHDITRFRANATLVMAGFVLAQQSLEVLLRETELLDTERDAFLRLNQVIAIPSALFSSYLRPSTFVFSAITGFVAGLFQAGQPEEIARSLYNRITHLPCSIL